jgi:hypothetical protein
MSISCAWCGLPCLQGGAITDWGLKCWWCYDGVRRRSEEDRNEMSNSCTDLRSRADEDTKEHAGVL